MAAAATIQPSSSTISLPNRHANAPSIRSSSGITRVAIRDKKTVAINDFVYITAPWAPGSGEPYLIARVMEFVTGSSSRKGSVTVASSSGTLQVRANVFLRQRDLNKKVASDPRLLYATMHSDIFAIENIRGLCIVRHRDLIGDAPELASWKKKEDHFYFYQSYDRYLHRYFDVILTGKIRNVPQDILSILRLRYSYIMTESSVAQDLCGPLRACFVCEKWASSIESIRCDVCKNYFHMDCLNPPLASKPGKGFSWTCAPCSRRQEAVALNLPLSRMAALDASAAIASSSSSGSSTSSDPTIPVNGPFHLHQILHTQRNSPLNSATASTRGNSRGRGRGRGGRGRGSSSQLTARPSLLASNDQSSDFSRSPSPANMQMIRTIDDERGTRCFERWPYRYFGECSSPTDILDPHDSVYPRITPRLGVRFQASPITWEAQVQLGKGVRISKEVESNDGNQSPLAEESSFKVKRLPGRPLKKKNNDTPVDSPVMAEVPLPPSVTPLSDAAINVNLSRFVTDKEIERGTDDSVEAIYRPGITEDRLVDKYVKLCRKQLPDVAVHIGMLNRAVELLTLYKGDLARALQTLTSSTNDELQVDIWTTKEVKDFDRLVVEYSPELRLLKREIPTKSAAQLVRYFAQWKRSKLREQFKHDKERLEKEQTDGKSLITSDQNTRAVSPSASILLDAEPDTSIPDGVFCRVCTTTQSTVWYKGPFDNVANRRMCYGCGVYWRKYAAEMPATHPDRKRDLEDGTLNTIAVLPAKLARLSKTDSSVKSSSGISTPTPNGTAQNLASTVSKASMPASVVARLDHLKCVMCNKSEPKAKLAQCSQCSLTVHQGCCGLTERDVQSPLWHCEACDNETTLEASLVPRCILCPLSSLPSSLSIDAPLTALDAVKPTEGNNWAHIHCSLFIPEIVYSEPERLRLVEGAGSLATWRYEAKCDLCNQQAGACVTCAEVSCKRTFHVSCALQQPLFTSGIEIIPAKNNKRDAHSVIAFKGETGYMSTVVFCGNHREAAKSRRLIDLAEMDPATELSAMQSFAMTNKGVKGRGNEANTYPLLRRAKRYDGVLTGKPVANENVHGRKGGRHSMHHSLRLSVMSTTPVDDSSDAAESRTSVQHANRKVCVCCDTQFSPYWWTLPDNASLLDKSDTINSEWLQKALQRKQSSPCLLCARCRHTILPPIATSL